MSNIYEKIENLCKNNNINITVMCKQSGVSRGTLTDFKMGRIKNLSTETLQKIADYFDISIDELLGNEKKPLVNNDQELTEYLDELKNRKEMRMLFSLAKGATKADVERAVAIIEALQKQGE